MCKKRITKPPDERRRELVDAARELFVEKGYEETSVSDIVRKVNVAQGTFYLYFKSKQEVLMAIVRESLAEVLRIIREVSAREGLPAVEKLKAVWDEVIASMTTRFNLVQAFYLRTNAPLYTQLMEESEPLILPVVSSIIRQGLAEGTFRVTHPDEAARFVIVLANNLFEQLARQRVGSEPLGPKGLTRSSPDLVDAFWEFVLGGLGATPARQV